MPPKNLIVMQGIPGSGKSTMARKLSADFVAERAGGLTGLTSKILSTDDFWTVEHPVPHAWADGERVTTTYLYDPERVVEAHRWNQRRAIEAMQDGTNLIIIDNTNIQKWQASFYFMVADLYGYEQQVVSVQVPIEVAIKRNAQRSFDRRVPEDVLRKMHADLEPLF